MELGAAGASDLRPTPAAIARVGKLRPGEGKGCAGPSGRKAQAPPPPRPQPRGEGVAPPGPAPQVERGGTLGHLHRLHTHVATSPNTHTHTGVHSRVHTHVITLMLTHPCHLPSPQHSPRAKRYPLHPAHRWRQTGTGLAKQWRFIGAGSARGCAEAAGSAHSWEAGRCEAPQGPRRPRDSTTCKTRGPFSSQLRRQRLRAARARTEEEASAPGRQGCQGGGLASLLAGAGPVMES